MPLPAEVRLYNPLFAKPDPDAGNFAADLNPNSLEVLADARLEPALAGDNASEPVQFERQGYFVPRSRQHAGQARLQPHRRPARYLGEGVGRRQGLIGSRLAVVAGGQTKEDDHG